MKRLHDRSGPDSAGAGEQRGSPPGPQATTFIAGMAILALLVTFLMVWRMPPAELPELLLWAGAALAGELLVFSTLTQRAQINMATTIHMAMVLLLAPNQILFALWLSRIAAKFLIQRQVWYRALFNVSQVLVATTAAWGVYSSLGGRPWVDGPPADLMLSALAFLAAGLTYHLINTFTVSRIVSLTTRIGLWRTWRDNYGYPMEIMNTWALILLAPVVALCVLNLGALGLVVFVAPVALLRQVSAEYVSLQNAQRSLVAAERVAAKNEISALVGHRINSALTTLSGQIQLIVMRRERLAQAELESRFGAIRESVEAIQKISQGLIDSCQQSRRVEWARVDSLVDTLLAAVRRHPALSGVRIVTHCDSTIDEIQVNRGQVQDVLRNVLLNAAESMADANVSDPTIHVSAVLHPIDDEVEFIVSDNGPGIAAELTHRVFEPGFSTRPGAGGFGLSTALRIVTNHHGQIHLDRSLEGGAQFRIVLPANGVKSAARRAA